MRQQGLESLAHTNAHDEGRRWAYAAVDEILRRVDLHKMTGESHLVIVSNEGGIRAVKIGTEEIFKKSRG